MPADQRAAAVTKAAAEETWEGFLKESVTADVGPIRVMQPAALLPDDKRFGCECPPFPAGTCCSPENPAPWDGSVVTGRGIRNSVPVQQMNVPGTRPVDG
jgi:hypothetical protein